MQGRRLPFVPWTRHQCLVQRLRGGVFVFPSFEHRLSTRCRLSLPQFLYLKPLTHKTWTQVLFHGSTFFSQCHNGRQTASRDWPSAQTVTMPPQPNITGGWWTTTSTSIGQTHSRSPWNCPGLCGRGHGVPAEEWGPGLRWWTPRQSYWRPLCLRLLGRMEEAPFFEAKPPSPCSRRTYSCWDDEHLERWVHCKKIVSEWCTYSTLLTDLQSTFVVRRNLTSAVLLCYTI